MYRAFRELCRNFPIKTVPQEFLNNSFIIIFQELYKSSVLTLTLEELWKSSERTYFT